MPLLKQAVFSCVVGVHLTYKLGNLKKPAGPHSNNCTNAVRETIFWPKVGTCVGPDWGFASSDLRSISQANASSLKP
ncbi:hypothetical protein GGD54_004378 [Rhizobium tropici]|uniref:Secreted protein n=1 Tax=Rhizobium tropici TaxID=398 RepID=A0ABR6R436_RHITR|nr:hypothetical protein [Rhizobium tropici]MBB5595930.1 hypothetical protein [Rhizobium tropici]MBB6493923.1 hypothetical protein [Rhizobium tropici]